MRVIEEVPNFYKIITLKTFRNTPGVTFDYFPLDLLPRIDSISRVLHEKNAISPNSIGEIKNPWYMHPYQDDNLLVLSGEREIDLFIPGHGQIEHFTVGHNKILRNGTLVYEGSNILVWSKNVFHRITSGPEGSSSLNLAVYYKGFNHDDNFNIYDLDFDTKEVILLREGYKDQQ
jgi:hypothetical protein